MNNINDIHNFYESNIPGYERKDIHRLNSFFIEMSGIKTSKPIVGILKNFIKFKNYVVFEWQGTTEIRNQPLLKQVKAKPDKFDENSIMPYGKHKGEKMFDIPFDYFEWLAANNRTTPYVTEFIQWRKKQFK